jgi:uncharacterized protein (DUF488 family)
VTFEVCTIGFTRSSAERFFERLEAAGVQRVLDVRLHNDSQLAGFAKAGDLPYFLRELLGAEYEHDTRLAPDEELFGAYRREQLPWAEFQNRYLRLLEQRGVPGVLDPSSFEAKRTALLCSEPVAANCHRGLLAGVLAREWGVTAVHL